MPNIEIAGHGALYAISSATLAMLVTSNPVHPERWRSMST
jgi:hypothetical protein